MPRPEFWAITSAPAAASPASTRSKGLPMPVVVGNRARLRLMRTRAATAVPRGLLD
ncbi:hypothetical protein ABZ379_01565 [Streptomyces canus]|uniref:hypothetical protein n=1 Tax=Streptomyces canus TaxID=58343 RepID=UPI0033E64F1B